jgi:RNA polymerase sigma factor (sigma-70 family)
MAGLTLRKVLGPLGGLVGGAAVEPTPDQELLARFLSAQDSQAFATLMERHAGMVLGVCRRILRNAHDAEDACQAVFLVLARQARSIRRSGSVASWLHGVAWRVANKLRYARTRRTAREVEAAAETPISSDPADISLREVQRIVDEELARLPGSYQAPLVLCYLEGRTQDEAARELGWSLTTLRGRLERGREMLRLRLIRRGVAGASALLLGALVPSLSSAAVPPTLLAGVAEASVPVSAGGALPAQISPQVAALTREALQTPLLTKVFLAVVAVGGAAMIGVLAFVLSGAWSTADPAARVQPEEADEAEVWSPLKRLEMPGCHVWSVAYSADGKRIAAGARGPALDTGVLRVWDADTGQPVFTLDTPRSVRCVAFAPDGQTLATAEHDGMARLRDAKNGEVRFTLRGHRSQIDTVAFDAAGQTLASTGWDGTVKLWDTATGLEVGMLTGHQGQVFTAAFGPRDTVATGGVDATARLWRPSTGKTLRTFRGHTDVVHWLALAPPDGKILATASWDKTVRLWDTSNGQALATLEGHTETVLAVAFSRDGKSLASSAGQRLVKDMPGEVILWDLVGQKARARVQTKDRAYGVAFSPDGSTLAAADWDGGVTLWKREPDRREARPAERDLKFVIAEAQPADDGPPKKEYAADFHPSLKGNQSELPGLIAFGPEASDCIRFEADGLRFTLPTNYPRQRPGTGVITDFGIKGDFEVTVSFEILPRPKANAPGAATELRLVMVPEEPGVPAVWHKANQNRAGLVREIAGANQAGQFLANATTWTEDIPRDKWGNENFSKVEQHSNQRSPAAATTGRLRLVRSGTKLYFLASDGNSDDFELLQKTEFGGKDLKNVRLLASTSGPAANLDVRITHLRIRADAFPKTAAAVPPTPTIDPPKRHWWIIALAATGCAAAAVAGLLAVWLLLRVSRRASGAAEPAAAPVPRMITLSCRSCGKRLKAKADRAGQKLKCPQCGKAVAVPTSSEREETP